MSETTKTPAPQNAIQATPPKAPNKPANTKDSGRVHLGGGTIAF